jgi:predicted lipoprotein with Yx(FWY)xxD motif
MKPILSKPAAALAALLLLSSPALAGPPGPSVATKEGVGRVIVDGAGMTLYIFKKDSPGQSACQGDCLARWPIYFSDGVPTAGLEARDFGTITRADGAKQTIYKGMPLYTFAGDKAAGDAKGQGLKDVWFVATP